MQINKQLFEDVLSGKLKGKFVFRNTCNINSVELKPNHTCIEEASKKDFYIIRMPDMLFNVVNSDGKSVYCCIKHKGEMENDSNFDVVNFITDTNMKEKELKIDIPDGYEIDKEKSSFEKIVFKEKCTYPKSLEEFCVNNKTKDKEYFISSGSKIFNTCHVQDRDYDEDRNVCKTKEEAEAFLALMQLKRLWHEYVDNYSGKVYNYYFIDSVSNINGCEFVVLPSCSVISKYLFKFPSRELAQEFLHNFKDLIIKIYPLWS